MKAGIIDPTTQCRIPKALNPQHHCTNNLNSLTKNCLHISITKTKFLLILALLFRFTGKMHELEKNNVQEKGGY